jgi:SAM-dependent methyltransferase
MTLAAHSCDLCGGALAPWRRGWVWRCVDCGALRSDLPVEIPGRSGGSALDEALRESGLEAVRRINNGRLLDVLAAHAPPDSRLLDVGCGPGFLLQAARLRGLEPQGLEPDANVVQAAAARGAVVRHGYFPQALTADERFGVIVFNDVLEHIPALDAALAASAAHLAPGGLLLVNAPDRRGLFFRAADLADRLGLCAAYDRLWQKGLPSPHVWYLTPNALARAARRHGLEPVARVRLKTIALAGLWSRIRYVKAQSLALSLAAFAFSVLTLPLARLLPADASATLFRKR